MVNILVDIDGVLAWGNIPHLVSLYNRLANLGIAEERLALIETRDAFCDLPEVQTHIANIGIERYLRQLARMQWHPLYVHKCNVMEGAVQGVNYLAPRVNALGYCTARVVHFNSSWNEHLACATREWLRDHNFPNDNLILFCNGVMEKLGTIAASIREQKQAVLLIDDSLEALLAAFDELPEEDQALLKKTLTIAAFGHEKCDAYYPVRVVPFSHWGEVINLAVEKSFRYAEIYPFTTGSE